MILRQLLSGLNEYQVVGNTAVEVAGVAFDSRSVKAGDVFVAYAGKHSDGHRFIPHALEQGAAAVVGEHAVAAEFPDSIPYIQVPDGRTALARLAASWHEHPGRKMTVVGVTGTDGKTTTVNLIESILSSAGRKTGMISTVNALVGDHYQDTGLHVTTPDALQIQGLLAQMASADTDVAILETTSHGLAQRRVVGVEYDVAVVTNITHEHLDEHGTWEQYLADKARLFHSISTSWRKPGVPKVAVLNADDASYSHLQPIPADRQISYALNTSADITATDIHIADGEATFTVHSPGAIFVIRTALIERFNVYNILAAISTGLALGVSVDAIQQGVAALKGVIGRMERIEEGQDFDAIVDFAHTPNALLRALETLRPQTKGRLIVVFGCAGLRDVYKREMMGKVAGELADVTVITAEDPRTEDLDDIIQQIAIGCEEAGAREGREYYRVPDRAEAIAFAVQLAHTDDIVVATGKGHEQSMCFGTIEYPWSDHQALRAALLEHLGRPGEVHAPRLPTAKPSRKR